MKFDPELKKALKLLPESEKDKLILRLLKKDLDLANRLRFELVDADSVEDKRDQAKQMIINKVNRVSSSLYSLGYLMMDLREISGEINNHVYITKDKVGEIILNCIMLRTTLELNNQHFSRVTYGKAYKLCIYIVNRIFKILLLINKQHEDLHLEFQEDVMALGRLLGQNPVLMKTSIQNGLDVNWLIQFSIPENLESIHKELKQNGFLK